MMCWYYVLMTLSTSEIVLLTTVAVLGIAAVVTSKPITEEPTQQYTPVTNYPSPKNATIVIEEID